MPPVRSPFAADAQEVAAHPEALAVYQNAARRGGFDPVGEIDLTPSYPQEDPAAVPAAPAAPTAAAPTELAPLPIAGPPPAAGRRGAVRPLAAEPFTVDHVVQAAPSVLPMVDRLLGAAEMFVAELRLIRVALERLAPPPVESAPSVEPVEAPVPDAVEGASDGAAGASEEPSP